MKIIKVNILLCLLALVLGSCEDFLESRDKGQAEFNLQMQQNSD